MGGTVRFVAGIEDDQLEGQEQDAPGSSLSLVDFLVALQDLEVPYLPCLPQVGLGALGFGLSKDVLQALVDTETSLAFRNGVPSMSTYDSQDIQDWYALITEIAILQYPPIRRNPHIANLMGIAWTYHPVDDKDYVWPCLVSRKATHGDLDAFLQRSGVSHQQRLEILHHIVDAVLTLHDCGIAHGDIKPDNVLVEEGSDSTLQCRLTDFGGAVIQGLERLPQGTPGWNAPELNLGSRRFFMTAGALRNADLYSLGLLVAHVLIPATDLRAAGMSLLRSAQLESPGESLDKIYSLQRQGTLSESFCAVARSCGLPANHVQLLESLLRGLLSPNSDERSFDKDVAASLRTLHARTSEDTTLSQLTLRLPLLSTSSEAASHCPHKVLQVEGIMQEADAIDYVLRQNIAADMERKQRLLSCLPCKRKYSKQLALIHRIGFGVPRNTDKSDEYLREAELTGEDVFGAAKRAEQAYFRRDPSEVVLETIGSKRLPIEDAIQEYRFSHRLQAAEVALTDEVVAREAEYGEWSVCTAELKQHLSQMWLLQGHFQKAEAAERRVMETHRRAYGAGSACALAAEALLAENISQQGRLREAESSFRHVATTQEELFGSGDPRVMATRMHLALNLVQQNQLNEATSILRQVQRERARTMGQLHPVTLATEISLSTALYTHGKTIECKKLLDAISEKCARLGDPTTTVMANLSLSNLYLEMEEFDSAQRKASLTLRYLTRSVESGDPMRILCLATISQIYGIRGELKIQEQHLRQALQEKGSLEDGHPNVLATRLQLARTLLGQAKFTESIGIAQSVATVLHGDVRMNTSLIIEAADTIAMCYSRDGEMDRAEAKLNALLQSVEESFGDTNPFTVKATMALANLYYDHGMYGKSKALLLAKLAFSRDSGMIRETNYMVNHLILCYHEENNFDEAFVLGKETLEWTTRAMGEKAQEVLSLRTVMAANLALKGERAEAERMLSRLLEDAQGSQTTKYIISRLAKVRSQSGDLAGAKELWERAVELATADRGLDHPETIKAVGNLLGFRSTYEELTPDLCQGLANNLERKRRLFGPSHPTTLKTMSELAYARSMSRDPGDHEEAGRLFDDIDKLLPGGRWDNALRQATYLAQRAELCHRLRDLGRAEQLERQTIALRQQHMVPDSPPILTATSNLASTLCARQSYGEAEALLRHVIEVRERSLGLEASLTMRSQSDLAAVLFFQGRLSEAATLYRRLLDTSIKKGDEPRIVKYRENELKTVEDKMRGMAREG